MRKSIFVLTSIAAAMLSGIAFAGNRGGEFTISPMESYYHFADKRAIDNVSVPNIALGYNFDRNWGIEADAGLINSDLNPPKVPNQIGVHGSLITVDGIYRFLPYKVLEPFVSFGVGVITLSPNGTDSEHQGNINAGLGAQVFIDDGIAFRAEARDLYTMSGGKNDYMLDLGMSFLLDGCCHCKSPAVAPKYKGD